MSTFLLTEYYLLKNKKQKLSNESPDYNYCSATKKEIVFPDEMICRVCTDPADIPISDKVENIYISSAIKCVASISVSILDCYPKYICKRCLDELKIALTFKTKCESTDLIFRQSSLSPVVHVNNPMPMVFHDFELILHHMKQKKLSLQKLPDLGSCKNNQIYKSKCSSDFKKLKEVSLKSYKCRRCKLLFDSKELLLEHHHQHNCICPPCTLCGKLVSNLSRHKKIVHFRSDKFTCHICGKVTYSSGGLRNHLLVHSDKFEYSCPLCPYRGKQQSYLTLHMRIHTGERPYLCSKCPAKFVNHSNLRKHQLTHSNKKYECNKCNKQFRLQKTLKEHYDAAHLNVRYRCSVCSRELWTRRKLLSHELRVHNREKHKLYEEVHKVIIKDDK